MDRADRLVSVDGRDAARGTDTVNWADSATISVRREIDWANINDGRVGRGDGDGVINWGDTADSTNTVDRADGLRVGVDRGDTAMGTRAMDRANGSGGGSRCGRGTATRLGLVGLAATDNSTVEWYS